MSEQIVISGNRVLAHGTDYSVTGNTVKCASTGRVFNNATIASVEELPSDIDSVGYEYHAGRFVPCAPFGIGGGNMAIVCGVDCKALKDSGIPAYPDFSRFAVVDYTGTGTSGAAYPNTVTLDFVPKFVCIVAQFPQGVQQLDETTILRSFPWSCVMGGSYGHSTLQAETGGYTYAFTTGADIVCNLTGKTITWYSSKGAAPQCNGASSPYKLYAWG